MTIKGLETLGQVWPPILVYVQEEEPGGDHIKTRYVRPTSSKMRLKC